MEHLAILRPSQHQLELQKLGAPYSLREWGILRDFMSPLHKEFGFRFGLWPNGEKLEQYAQQVTNQAPGNGWPLLVKTNEEVWEESRMRGLLSGQSVSLEKKHPDEEEFLAKFGPMQDDIRSLYVQAYAQQRVVDGHNIFLQWVFSLPRQNEAIRELDLNLMKRRIEEGVRLFPRRLWEKSWDNPEALEVVINAGSNWIQAVKDYWEGKLSAKRPDGG